MGVILGFGLILVLLIVLLVYIIFSTIISIIFQGLGIMKMHKMLGLKGGWMAFVPILNSYALGKVAEQYVKPDGKKSIKLSKIIIIGYLAYFIPILIFIFLLFLSEIFTVNEFISVIFLLDCLLSIVIFSANVIIYYIALWRVFKIFSKKEGIVNFIFAILVPIYGPVAIFAIRNSIPAYVEIETEKTPDVIEAVVE